ncbi:MAG: hypothetical protein H5U00_10495 [Clostridia bacterium]|nr:hypothetical protein [Clostridia bacterium]
MVPDRAGAYLLYQNMNAVGAPSFSAEEQQAVKALAQKYDVPLRELSSAILPPQYELSRASADTGDVSHLAPLLSLTAACAAQGSPGHSPVDLEQYGSSMGQKGMLFASKCLVVPRST